MSKSKFFKMGEMIAEAQMGKDSPWCNECLERDCKIVPVEGMGDKCEMVKIYHEVILKDVDL